MPPIEPGDDICLRFQDSTGEKRSEEDWEKFREAVNALLREFDFKLCQWGSWKEMGKYYMGEKAYIEELLRKYPERPGDREVA